MKGKLEFVHSLCTLYTLLSSQLAEDLHLGSLCAIHVARPHGNCILSPQAVAKAKQI